MIHKTTGGRSIITVLGLILLLPVMWSPVTHAQEGGFTQADRDRLIRLEAILDTFMKATDQRFSELRQDMNARLGQVDKRIEQVDTRIDELRFDMNARFEQFLTFLLITVTVFGGITAAMIALVIWDRRTMIGQAKKELEEKLSLFTEKREREVVEKSTEAVLVRLQQEGTLPKLVKVLQNRAAQDPELSRELKKFGLLEG